MSAQYADGNGRS